MKTDFGAIAEKVSPEPKWYDIKHWKIGEWGSLASIIGIALWLGEKAGAAAGGYVGTRKRRRRR